MFAFSSNSFRATFVAFASLAVSITFAASPAVAGSTIVDAMVVPGYGPQGQAAPIPQSYPGPQSYSGQQAYASGPVYAAPRPAALPAPGRGQYGGGFIEMLMNAGGPPPMPAGVLYNRPGAALVAPPQARGYAAYALAQPAYEPRRTIDPQFQRSEVDYPSQEPAGTIVVDTPSKHLYLVNGGGRAMRYGIGVGRPGFMWSGVKSITRKAEWPDWTPPSEMLLRRPDLPRHMAGGPENPLGARAMYLGSSLYRIHGTNEPYTIGQNVSSGCIRMMNDDVVDLYGRVRVGTKVLVM